MIWFSWKNVLRPLDKNLFMPLVLTAPADAGIHKKS